MKKYMAMVSIPFLAVTSPVQAEQPAGEIGYEKGSLGYDALIAGDNAAAISQLSAANLDANDPARLINLGQAHARIGDIGQAVTYLSAAQGVENVQLVLADGTIMSSRKAASIALERINQRLASR